jgi:hypothetical protein
MSMFSLCRYLRLEVSAVKFQDLQNNATWDEFMPLILYGIYTDSA